MMLFDEMLYSYSEDFFNSCMEAYREQLPPFGETRSKIFGMIAENDYCSESEIMLIADYYTSIESDEGVDFDYLICLIYDMALILGIAEYDENTNRIEPVRAATEYVLQISDNYCLCNSAIINGSKRLLHNETAFFFEVTGEGIKVLSGTHIGTENFDFSIEEDGEEDCVYYVEHYHKGLLSQLWEQVKPQEYVHLLENEATCEYCMIKTHYTKSELLEMFAESNTNFYMFLSNINAEIIATDGHICLSDWTGYEAE